MSFLRAFGWFWWDLIIGDDWRIAAYVVLILGAAAALAAAGVRGEYVAVGALLALMASFAVFVTRDVRR